jgi:hypothetical protein
MIPMPQTGAMPGVWMLVALVAACSGPAEPAASNDHPVPGGSWPPTVGDVWPSLASAFDFEGCVAYGGVPVGTSVQEFTVVGVRSVSNLANDGTPFIVVNPMMFQEPARSRRFLYFHECAHNMLQHPALRAVDSAPEPIDQEYDANCLAASYLLRNELFTRLDIDFMLLVLENNRGPDRPPGQAAALVACLQAQGLY